MSDRLSDIGFDDISVRKISVDRQIGIPETAIPKEIFGNPVGSTVAKQGEAVMGQIVGEIVDDLIHCFDGSKLVVPQEAKLITGKVC